jgi:hypothetical protein
MIIVLTLDPIDFYTSIEQLVVFHFLIESSADAEYNIY